MRKKGKRTLTGRKPGVVKKTLKGVKDYIKEDREINREADRKVYRTKENLSKDYMADEVAKEKRKIRKQRGSSLFQHVKKYF